MRCRVAVTGRPRGLWTTPWLLSDYDESGLLIGKLAPGTRVIILMTRTQDNHCMREEGIAQVLVHGLVGWIRMTAFEPAHAPLTS